MLAKYCRCAVFRGRSDATLIRIVLHRTNFSDDWGFSEDDFVHDASACRQAHRQPVVSAMCLVFAVSEDLDDPCKDLLSRAYEAACDELQSDHQLSSEALGQLVEAMTTALLDGRHASSPS